MDRLVNRLVKQKRLLEAMEQQQKQDISGEQDLEPAQTTTSGTKSKKNIRKFRILIGWRDNPKGPKKVLIIGGKEYDPYGGVTLENTCPKKLQRVFSRAKAEGSQSQSQIERKSFLWGNFLSDLGSVVAPFQDAGDAFLPLFCFCFPCFLLWRANYLDKVQHKLLDDFVKRHYKVFQDAGLYLRHRDISAQLLLCGFNTSQSMSVVEIIWDPSLETDRL